MQQINFMWSISRKPIFGDHIRVNRGFYLHHGIYLDDENVVQFGTEAGVEISASNARVMIVSLKDFLKGGTLEVREYSIEEEKKKRKPTDIVNYALAHIGEAGYDLISNNCEHFANRCVFGESYSEQVDDVMSLFRRYVDEGRN